MKALSIVYPGGTKIARGEKTIEVRSWRPPDGFDEELLIVENRKFLREDGEVDPSGVPVAIVKIRRVREFLKEDIPAACASRWEPGYFAWELAEVRPLTGSGEVMAARGLYEVVFHLGDKP